MISVASVCSETVLDYNQQDTHKQVGLPVPSSRSNFGCWRLSEFDSLMACSQASLAYSKLEYYNRANHLPIFAYTYWNTRSASLRFSLSSFSWMRPSSSWQKQSLQQHWPHSQEPAKPELSLPPEL